MQASQMLHSHRVTGSEVTRSRAVFGRPQAVTLHGCSSEYGAYWSRDGQYIDIIVYRDIKTPQ